MVQTRRELVESNPNNESNRIDPMEQLMENILGYMQGFQPANQRIDVFERYQEQNPLVFQGKASTLMEVSFG